MVDVVVVVQWLEWLQNILEFYFGVYLVLMILVLLIVVGLVNWVIKCILLCGLWCLFSCFFGVDIGRGSYLMWVILCLFNVVFSQVIVLGICIVLDLLLGLVSFIIGVCQVWVILIVVLVILYVLDVVNDLYECCFEVCNKLIKGYLQVVKIVFFVIVGLLIVVILVGVDLCYLVIGFGVVMVVLMLIFQDIILLLVVSVQISGDGCVCIGDWIEMFSQNVDGDVIDIVLYIIIVQNFDKIIIIILIKKLVIELFKNWCGMQEVGGCWIKCVLYLDQYSVGFFDDGDLVFFGEFVLLCEYLCDKEQELGQWNGCLCEQGVVEVNSCWVINLGIFCVYVECYLCSYLGIYIDMILLVWQLQFIIEGLLLELYCFICSIVWSEYEVVQLDIFDYLLVILLVFGLWVFQVFSDVMLMVGQCQLVGLE